MLRRLDRLSVLAIAAITALAISGCALFDSEAESKGRKLFSFYCAHCHGDKGNGNGINASKLDPRPRDLTDSVEDYMAGASNEEVFNAIRDGVGGVITSSGTFSHGMELDEEYAVGSTLMPYWGYTFSEEELWSLAAFVRSLHKNDAEEIVLTEEMDSTRPYQTVEVDVDLNVTGPERQNLIEMGARYYDEKYACSSCHSVDGVGGEVGPELSRAGFRMRSDWVYRWIQQASSIKKHTKMPNFAMPREDAYAITIYLSTLK